MENLFHIFLWYGAPIGLGLTAVVVVSGRFAIPKDAGRPLSEDEYDAYLKRYDRYREEALIETKGAIDIAIMALRASILLNGASSAAVLAFLSAQASAHHPVAPFVDVLLLFLAGTLAAVVATSFAYLRMYYATGNWNYWLHKGGPEPVTKVTGEAMQGIAFFLVVVSYVLFTAGGIKAAKVLQSM